MIANPQRAIVLKMSAVKADNLYMQLGFARKFVQAFETDSDVHLNELETWMEILHNAARAYDGTKQIVADVRLPARSSVLND